MLNKIFCGCNAFCFWKKKHEEDVRTYFAIEEEETPITTLKTAINDLIRTVAGNVTGKMAFYPSANITKEDHDSLLQGLDKVFNPVLNFFDDKENKAIHDSLLTIQQALNNLLMRIRENIKQTELDSRKHTSPHYIKNLHKKIKLNEIQKQIKESLEFLQIEYNNAIENKSAPPKQESPMQSI